MLTPGCSPGLLAGLTLCLKKQVHWHVIGLGSGPEVHSIFFEGHTFLVRSHRLSSLEISPATYLTAQTTPGTAGWFRMFCQILSHHQGNLIFQEPGGKAVQGMAWVQGSVWCCSSKAPPAPQCSIPLQSGPDQVAWLGPCWPI